jgi:hypothetical protein
MIAAPDLTGMADPKRAYAAGLAVGFGDQAVRRRVAADPRELERQRAPGCSLYFLA